jgi:hypothetical protein
MSGPVFIRTVTHNYLCEITGPAVDGFMPVSHVSWVADTGIRLGQFLTSGPAAASEIEPMPTCTHIGVGAIIDVSTWVHALPEMAS